MKSLETVLEFSSSENTWHPHTQIWTQSIWLLMKSFRNPVTATHYHNYLSDKLLDHHNFGGRPRQSLPINWKVMFLSLLICIGQKYSVSKPLFSLLVCMYWPSRTSTPSQSEIFSQIRSTPLPFPLLIWAEREYFTLGYADFSEKECYCKQQR